MTKRWKKWNTLISQHLTLYKYLILLYKNALLFELDIFVIETYKPPSVQIEIYVHKYLLTSMTYEVTFLG